MPTASTHMPMEHPNCFTDSSRGTVQEITVVLSRLQGHPGSLGVHLRATGRAHPGSGRFERGGRQSFCISAAVLGISSYSCNRPVHSLAALVLWPCCRGPVLRSLKIDVAASRLCFSHLVYTQVIHRFRSPHRNQYVASRRFSHSHSEFWRRLRLMISDEQQLNMPIASSSDSQFDSSLDLSAGLIPLVLLRSC